MILLHTSFCLLLSWFYLNSLHVLHDFIVILCVTSHLGDLSTVCLMLCADIRTVCVS